MLRMFSSLSTAEFIRLSSVSYLRGRNQRGLQSLQLDIDCVISEEKVNPSTSEMSSPRFSCNFEEIANGTDGHQGYLRGTVHHVSEASPATDRSQASWLKDDYGAMVTLVAWGPAAASPDTWVEQETVYVLGLTSRRKKKSSL